MKRLLLSFLLTAAFLSVKLSALASEENASPKVRFALAGDSTVAENSGWGPAFAKLLAPTAECLNFARGGQSSKSFRDSKNWQKALDSKPNYILIQFGHNDQPGKGPNRETDPKTTYPENLSRFVDEARAIGAEPVLITSMARRTFDNGKIRHDLEPYAEAVRKVAEEKKVPIIDLNARSIALLEKLGPEGTKPFDPVTKDGRPDHTHLSPRGGEVMAQIVAEDLVKVLSKVKPYFTQNPS